MSRSSDTEATSASPIEQKPQAKKAVRKKNSHRRLAAAVVAVLICGGVALWTVIRVEGRREGNREVQISSRERLERADEVITTIGPGIHAPASDDQGQFVLATASPEQQELDLAISECRTLIRMRPGDADAQAKLGSLLIDRGKFDEAIVALREAARLKPGRSDVHCKLGRALGAQGKLVEAVAEFRETIRLEPGNVDARKCLGETLAKQGKIDEAAAEYTEADRLKFEPNVALMSLKLLEKGAADVSRSRTHEGEFHGDVDVSDTGATDRATSGVQAGPQSVAGFYNRGISFAKGAEFDKAISDLNDAIRLDSRFAAAYVVRGEIWLSKNELEKAMGDLNEAVRLDPHGRAYNVRGLIWARKKCYDSAIDDYNEAIRLDPGDAVAHTGRGYAWSQQKEYEKAIADYEASIRLEPEDAGALNGLAWLESTCPDAKYRDGKKAIELASKACELTKWKEPMIVDTLAAAYAESGEFESARLLGRPKRSSCSRTRRRSVSFGAASSSISRDGRIAAERPN